MALSSSQARKNRKIGADFERKVRAEFEGLGYTVSKWQNNVEGDEIVPAKSNRFLMRSTGFPDFVMFKPKQSQIIIGGYPEKKVIEELMKSYKEGTEQNSVIVTSEGIDIKSNGYELMLVECKYAGKLSKDEKQKIEVLKRRGFKCLLCYNDDGEVAYTVL